MSGLRILLLRSDVRHTAMQLPFEPSGSQGKKEDMEAA